MNAAPFIIEVRWDMARASRVVDFAARHLRWMPQWMLERPLTFVAALAVLRTLTIEGRGRIYGWREAVARAREMAR